ncbi:hypothetical protein BCR44DRAFT_1041446 [Catenaria anguillulae PL171]|uniref:RRM domain-containing protein n=1 Tax=Catenaria anguillulae PL171 TaxID=765915 RepID=A0A1Y2HVM3_9FUNG|nr:hypothetical protein BCR44DRAFT_1041446 [Catenaria anguillulae PL171]
MKDWMNRPYAFVQYRLVADAQRAIEESHDTVVDGRHVRVEAARVNRTLFLSKLPKTMSDDILHQFMSKWGKVEDVTLVMNQLTGRPKGCAFAKFRYREDAIRAYLHIRQQGKWGVEWAANLEKNKPETDRSSIFVGQLNPDEATEAAVRARFATYGTLENVHLIVADGEAFAFIKYDDETGSQLAINNENGKEFQGSRILVQYRESPEGKSPMVRRPLGREPKPLTRPQSNKPATFISPSAGYVLTRPSIESGRTVSVDSSTQLEDLNSIKESAPQQQQQHQQQQQQQHGAASNPHRLHGSTNLFPTGGNPPSGPSVSSGAPTYYSHLPNIPTMHQHGYLPYYPPPYMYGGYYGYHPGYYPPPHMPHHHPHHHHGGCYPPPPAHQRPHMYHGYPPNIPYGDLSHSQQQHHHQLGTVQEVSGGAGQSLQLQGYPGTQQDAYHAAIQEHLANASATSGTNTGGGASGGGGGFSGAMYDSFYGGVGYPPMDPSAANTDLVRHFATSSPAPIRVPTTPYPIVQAQQHPPEFPSPPAAAATSDSKSGSTLSGHVPPSSTAVPKSLFSTLTASAAAGRAEHLESMYTQSLKSALVGLSSADVANTPLASVVALSSATSGVAPLPPTLGPRSSSTNVEAPAEGSLGGGVGATGASGSGSGTPAALTTGFGNAFGSALFPPFAPGTSATVGERTGSAATRGGGGNAAVGKRGSPESLVAGIVESGNATYASW